MRVTLLALLASCAYAEPDEVSLYGFQSWGESIGSGFGPFRTSTSYDSAGYAVGIGLTWALDEPDRPRLTIPPGAYPAKKLARAHTTPSRESEHKTDPTHGERVDPDEPTGHTLPIWASSAIAIITALSAAGVFRKRDEIADWYRARQHGAPTHDSTAESEPGPEPEPETSTRL